MSAGCGGAFDAHDKAQADALREASPCRACLRAIMGEFAIGQSVLRREDPRLLRGYGHFFDDLKLADQLHAAIVRSPHAHADVTGIETRAALQIPGVHAVLTGAEYRADAVG